MFRMPFKFYGVVFAFKIFKRNQNIQKKIFEFIFWKLSPHAMQIAESIFRLNWSFK